MRSTKIKTLCSSSLWTCLHHMVILRSQNKITDFLMILAWASPFKPIIITLPIIGNDKYGTTVSFNYSLYEDSTIMYILTDSVCA